MTTSELADLVDDMAARLWAAGVRPGEHIAPTRRTTSTSTSWPAPPPGSAPPRRCCRPR
ncbi:hypothetical protein NKH77_39465 [Streptomyces sp. M19]